MLKIKEKYLHCNIVFKGKEISLEDIPSSSYQYYYDNGLKDLFEEIKVIKYKGVKEDKKSSIKNDKDSKRGK